MSRIRNVVFLLFLTLSSTCIEAYRILGVFPFNGKSHDMMFNALMVGLARRNHQVDVITHFPPKNPPPNYRTLINLHGTLPAVLNNCTVELRFNDIITIIGYKSGNEICELLAMDGIQKIIKNPPNDPPYDVIITEAFGANCFMGLGHVLKTPVIAITSSTEFPWIADFAGNHDNLALVPSYFTENFDRGKFLHRLSNFVSHHWNKYKFHKITEGQTQLMRKYLSPDIPGIREVEKNIALLLINRSPLIDGPKPITASMVEVSGLHLEENESPKASPELQKWLDDSKDGIVYFSFGSMVLIETLPLDTIKGMYESFEKIAPTRVLMKIADESKLPPGLPKNVKTLPWIPQQAVLAHENVRVYLTHGGLMGSQEALYHGVPMIGVPLFSDQPQNVEKFIGLNMAVKIDYSNLTTSALDEALNTVLNNPKYRESAKLNSKLFKDRPMKAMDTAVFWVEYVARNGNVMRPPVFKLSWWQVALLDVYGFLFLCVAATFALVYYATNYLTKRMVIFLTQKYLLLKQFRKVKAH